MATLARCEFDATNSDTGRLLTDVSVEVRLESGGLVQVYADRSGATPLGNPFTVADGHVAFHAAGGAYRIILTAGAYSRERRFVAIGLAAETDFTLSRPAGGWDAEVLYAIGDLTYHAGYMFISRIDANLDNEPDVTTPGDSTEWMFAGTALPGEGLRFDAQVDDLPDLAAFDDVSARFAVLVSDMGDGRSAIVVMGDGGSGDWSDPAYLTGPVGPPGDMQNDDNLSGLTDVPAARANLGLGDSSTKDVGTTADTVAAGDDSRIVNALQSDAEGQEVEGGASVVPKPLGNLSGASITVDPSVRPIQSITNNGAGSILPGSVTGAYFLEVINASGAGAITTTGWTLKGDIFDITTTSKFLCSCVVTSNMKVMTVLKVA